MATKNITARPATGPLPRFFDAIDAPKKVHIALKKGIANILTQTLKGIEMSGKSAVVETVERAEAGELTPSENLERTGVATMGREGSNVERFEQLIEKGLPAMITDIGTIILSGKALTTEQKALISDRKLLLNQEKEELVLERKLAKDKTGLVAKELEALKDEKAITQKRIGE